MSKSLPLYLQQPSLEIIQLIEVPPPPPQQRTFPASSFMSSSYASSSSSDQSDHESACSSYCSSDPEEDASRLSVPDDTYKTRLHRVLLWREKLMKALGTSSSGTPLVDLRLIQVFIFLAAPPPPPSTHLKRKADDDEPELDDDTVSVYHRMRCSSKSAVLTLRRAGISFVEAVALEQLPVTCAVVAEHRECPLLPRMRRVLHHAAEPPAACRRTFSQRCMSSRGRVRFRSMTSTPVPTHAPPSPSTLSARIPASRHGSLHRFLH